MTKVGAKEETKLVDVSEFLSESQIYNLDLFKLIKYCNVSQICHKLNGFVEKYKSGNSENVQPEKKGVSAFLSSIKNSSDSKEANSETIVKETATNSENRPPSNCLQSIVEILNCLCMENGESRMVMTTGARLQDGRIRCRAGHVI